jgi:hypothetical protein
MKNNYSGMMVYPVKQVSLAFFLLFAIAVFSGNTQQIVSIGLTKMNVLYRGVDNPAVVAVSGVRQNDIKLTTNNGTIRQVDNQFILSPTRLGNELITVLVNDKVVGTEEFRVKDLPDPVAKVDNHKSGIVEKDWLLNAVGLTAELEGSDFYFPFKIISFTLSVSDKEYTYDKMSNSDKFTNEQIELLKKVKVDQKVRIEDIKVMGPEGSPRDLQPLVFTIK